jgi:hypothetical protein
LATATILAGGALAAERPRDRAAARVSRHPGQLRTWAISTLGVPESVPFLHAIVMLPPLEKELAAPTDCVIREA